MAKNRSSIMNCASFSTTIKPEQEIETVTELLPAIADADLSFGPINIVMKGLIEFHNFIDQPWYITICVFGAVVRLLATPIVVKLKQNGARLAYAKDDLAKAQIQMTKFKENNNTNEPTSRKELLSFLQKVYSKHQASPFKTIGLVLLQMPIYSCCFFAVRRVCTQYNDLQFGGSISIPDLSIADPTLLLGPVTSLIMFTSLKMGLSDQQAAETQATDETSIKQRKMMSMIGTGLSIGFIPISLYMPSGCVMYILSTTSTVFASNLFLRFDFVKRLLKMHPDNLPGKLIDDKNRKNLVSGKTNKLKKKSKRKPKLVDK